MAGNDDFEVVYIDKMSKDDEDQIDISDGAEQHHAISSIISAGTDDEMEQAEKSKQYVMVTKWSEAQSKRLMSLYTEHINNIGDGEGFRNKKTMYTYIANKLNHEFDLELNYTQVESRYKNIMKRKRKLTGLDSNESPSSFNFSKMISGNPFNDSVKREHPLDSSNSQTQKNSVDNDNDPGPTATKRIFSTEGEIGDEKMFNIYLDYKRERHRDKMRFLKQVEEDKKFRDIQKQRRHDEKMDVMRDLTSALLQRL